MKEERKENEEKEEMHKQEEGRGKKEKTEGTNIFLYSSFIWK